MRTRPVGQGTAAMQVGAVGLGLWPLTSGWEYTQEGANAAVAAALDAGVTLLDTADTYCPDEHSIGEGERVLARALAAYGGTSGVLVATKGGRTRTADGDWGMDGRPEHLKAACEASLRRLGVDAIGLYHHHWPDPEVPYADTVGALAELYHEGKIRRVGISNVSVEQIRLAESILGPGVLASVQDEMSPDVDDWHAALDHCTEQGIAFLAYSPLGGPEAAAGLGERHPAFAQVARAHGVSPQRVALAWLLARSPVLIPLAGSRRPATIVDSAAATELVLDPADLAALDAAGRSNGD